MDKSYIAMKDVGQVYAYSLLVMYGLAESSAEAKRLIQSGDMKIDGKPTQDPSEVLDLETLKGHLVQVGRQCRIIGRADIITLTGL